MPATFTVYVSHVDFDIYALPKGTVVIGNIPPSKVVQEVGRLVKLFRKGQNIRIATYDMAILHELDLQLKDEENVQGICVEGDTVISTVQGPIPDPCPPLDFALEQDDRIMKQSMKK